MAAGPSAAARWRARLAQGAMAWGFWRRGELGRRSGGAGTGTAGFGGAVAISVRSRRKEPDGCGFMRVPNATEKETEEES